MRHCPHWLSAAGPVRISRGHAHPLIAIASVYWATHVTTAIEAFAQIGISHNLLMLKGLEDDLSLKLADNGLSRCSAVVGAGPRKQGRLTPKCQDNLCRVVSVFTSRHVRQLRAPRLGFVGFVPGFVEVHELPQ